MLKAESRGLFEGGEGGKKRNKASNSSFQLEGGGNCREAMTLEESASVVVAGVRIVRQIVGQKEAPTDEPSRPDL